MLVSLGFIGIANMPNLLSHPVTSIRGDVVRVTCVNNSDPETASQLMAIIWRIYVPMAVILVLNITVYRRLRQTKARVAVANVTSQSKQARDMSNKQRRFVVSTLLIDLVFVFFYTPITAYLSMFINFYFNRSSWSLFGITVANLFLNIALFLIYLYSVAIIFMFLIFNRYFRIEVVTLLRLNRFFPQIEQSVLQTRSAANQSVN